MSGVFRQSWSRPPRNRARWVPSARQTEDFSASVTVAVTISANLKQGRLFASSRTLAVTATGALATFTGPLASSRPVIITVSAQLTATSLIEFLREAIVWLLIVHDEKTADMDDARGTGLRPVLDLAASEVNYVEQAISEVERAISMAGRF